MGPPCQVHPVGLPESLWQLHHNSMSPFFTSLTHQDAIPKIPAQNLLHANLFPEEPGGHSTGAPTTSHPPAQSLVKEYGSSPPLLPFSDRDRTQGLCLPGKRTSAEYFPAPFLLWT
jgi:hypothetical protein